MRVAVAGGTGLVGSLTVDAARAAGHEVVVLARSTGVDLISGAGVDAALAGCTAVIDASNVTTMSRKKATDFFVTGTRTLLESGERAGVAHHVTLSIVGIDRVPLGYYAAKVAQEKIALASARTSVLRATQFHEFAEQTLDRMPGPLVLVPKMRSQPVAAAEVASALVALAAGDPVGHAGDIAGPQVLEMAELCRRVLRVRGSRRVVLSLRLPGAAGAAMAGEGLLPREAGRRGTQTFDEWLDAHGR